MESLSETELPVSPPKRMPSWLRPLSGYELFTPASALLVLLVTLASFEWGPLARVFFMGSTGGLLVWLVLSISRRLARAEEQTREAADTIESLRRESQRTAAQVALANENTKLCEDLRLAVGEREELLAVISHELKNALAVVDVYTMLALRNMGTGDMAGLVQREHLEKIHDAKERMSRMIQDLLDLEKMKAGKFEPRRQPESIIPLVRGVVDTFEPIATRKGVSIIQSLPERDRLFNVDRDGVFRLLSNLLGNAVKFVPEGGEVRVSVAFEERNLVLKVSDNGPGIDAQELPHVFERYWQSKATANLGTGLGLAIVRGIAQAHGGTVRADSSPAGGAVFTVALPSGN